MPLYFNALLKPNQDILIQTLKSQDSSKLFKLVENNRAYLREFLGWVDKSITENDTLTFIKIQEDKMQKKEALIFSVWYQKEIVGLIDLHAIDHANHSANIGYWISKDTQGKGIITKSVKAAIDYAFEKLSLHRIQILCATENKKSQAIPLRLGFSHEGTLKDAIWHYGNYFDAQLYGLVKTSN
jgi:ribosomal-protein-serine acetyltransferase